MNTYSIPEIVAMFGGGSGYWLREGLRVGRFPYLKVGRERRFTEQHVTAIAAELERKAIPRREPAAADVAVFGATQRSAKAHRNRVAS